MIDAEEARTRQLFWGKSFNDEHESIDLLRDRQTDT